VLATCCLNAVNFVVKLVPSIYSSDVTWIVFLNPGTLSGVTTAVAILE
jgi:hypothetical protein